MDDERRKEFNEDCGGEACKEKGCVYVKYSGSDAANYDVGLHNAGRSLLTDGEYYKVPKALAEELLEDPAFEKATKKDAEAHEKESGNDENPDEESGEEVKENE